MPGKRIDYIDWDEFFMGVAMLAANRSKDPKTQVGACLVKNNRVLSSGYNGTPPGWSDDEFPWDSVGEKTGDVTEIKNNFVLHAEANTLSYCKEDLEGSTMYVTFSPCKECTKLLAQRGVKRIVYLKKYTDENSNIISAMIRERAGIIQEPFREDSDEMTKEEYRALLKQMQSLIKTIHQTEIAQDINVGPKMLKKYEKKGDNQQNS